MWVMSKIGFYSIVRDKTNPALVQVRSREIGDLENLKKMAGLSQEIILTPQADYPARMVVSTGDMFHILETLGESIEYTNFKDEIHRTPDQSYKSDAYMDIWVTMRQTQFPGARYPGITTRSLPRSKP